MYAYITTSNQAGISARINYFMKYRLLEILSCPDCNGDLYLETFNTEPVEYGTLEINTSSTSCRNYCGLHKCEVSLISPHECINCYKTEIIEGKLACKCGYACPIIGGIPRILPKDLLAENLRHYHKNFIDKYPDTISTKDNSAYTTKKKIATMHAFGYQWTTFVRNFEYFRDIFLGFVKPFLNEEDFRNKLVLEVGCGSGRPASVASSFGAEVIAIDISEAVQTAYMQSKYYPKLHVIQADAYSLPVKPCLDFVYSVGVLQHLPDPGSAIKSIARVVPSGHKFVIWVYAKRELWYQPIEWLRKLSVRMPYHLLHGLSFILAVLSEIFLLIPYRILSRFKLTQALAEKIPGRIYARFPFKENVLGWFDRLGAPVTHYFSKYEVERMLTNAGFDDIKIVARPDASASWVAQGIRK